MDLARPDLAGAVFETLCEVESDRGRFEAAEAACRRALALDPARALSRQLLDEISRRKRNDE